MRSVGWRQAHGGGKPASVSQSVTVFSNYCIRTVQPTSLTANALIYVECGQYISRNQQVGEGEGGLHLLVAVTVVCNAAAASTRQAM